MLGVLSGGVIEQRRQTSVVPLVCDLDCSDAPVVRCSH
jgi:hypothetical protein